MSRGVNLWLTASLGLLLGLLSPVFFVFSSVSAVSPYDNIIKTNSNIILGDSTTDYATTYVSLMQNVCQNTAGAFSAYTSTVSNNNGKWAILFNKSNAELMFFFSTDKLDFSFQNSPYSPNFPSFGMDAGSTWSMIRITKYNDGHPGSCEYYQNLSSNKFNPLIDTSSTLSTNPNGWTVFLVNAPITYPSDYSGVIIPDSFTPTTTHYPQFSYAVDNKHVSATYLQNIPYDNNSLINMHWELFKKNGSNYDPVNDKWHPAYGVYEYDVSEFGDYRLKLSFSVKPPGILPDDITVKSITQDFVVDGSTYASSTTKTDCTNGTCAPPSVYEDCSTYGVDLIGGIGCQMRNFGKWLQWLFTFLFIPSVSSLTSLFDEANGFLHQKLGLLLYPFDWFGLVFNSMMNSVTSCAGMNVSAIPGVQQNGTLFGSHVNLNPCSAQQNFPQLYNIAVFFIRIFIVFAMVVAVHRKLLATINDHGSRGERLYG